MRHASTTSSLRITCRSRAPPRAHAPACRDWPWICHGRCARTAGMRWEIGPGRRCVLPWLPRGPRGIYECWYIYTHTDSHRVLLLLQAHGHYIHTRAQRLYACCCSTKPSPPTHTLPVTCSNSRCAAHAPRTQGTCPTRTDACTHALARRRSNVRTVQTVTGGRSLCARTYESYMNTSSHASTHPRGSGAPSLPTVRPCVSAQSSQDPLSVLRVPLVSAPSTP
jgi:hypothetical protein